MTSMVVGGSIMTGFGVLVLVILVAYSRNETWRMTAARNRSCDRRSATQSCNTGWKDHNRRVESGIC